MPDKYLVKWLKLALDDIQSIAEYISKDDPEIAQSVVMAIWDATENLSYFPGRAKAGRVPETKELILTSLPYFIAFRVRNKTVEILRVIHTSRNWP